MLEYQQIFYFCIVYMPFLFFALRLYYKKLNLKYYKIIWKIFISETNFHGFDFRWWTWNERSEWKLISDWIEILHIEFQVRTCIDCIHYSTSSETVAQCCKVVKYRHTLSLKSLYGHSYVCYKTSLNIGSLEWAGTAPPSS